MFSGIEWVKWRSITTTFILSITHLLFASITFSACSCNILRCHRFNLIIEKTLYHYRDSIWLPTIQLKPENKLNCVYQWLRFIDIWTHHLVLCYSGLSPLCSVWRLLRAAGYLTKVQAHFWVVVEWIQRLWNMPLFLSTLHDKTWVSQKLVLPPPA